MQMESKDVGVDKMMMAPTAYKQFDQLAEDWHKLSKPPPHYITFYQRLVNMFFNNSYTFEQGITAGKKALSPNRYSIENFEDVGLHFKIAVVPLSLQCPLRNPVHVFFCRRSFCSRAKQWNDPAARRHHQRLSEKPGLAPC